MKVRSLATNLICEFLIDLIGMFLIAMGVILVLMMSPPLDLIAIIPMVMGYMILKRDANPEITHKVELVKKNE